MRIALIADTYPPLRTSGAVQLRDLSREFVRQGHELTVMLPAVGLRQPWALDEMEGVQILRMPAPRTKDVGYLRRTLGELVMPFAMLRGLRTSPLKGVSWDGVVWYSPSIFHGPFVRSLKNSSGCKGYLIVRDIFPEWAADMGLMGRGMPFLFFKAVERYQYSVANVVGVQTPGNRTYFERWRQKPGRVLEVLHNWLGSSTPARCVIRLDETILSGRRVFLYAGNMGVAQGMDTILDLAACFRGNRSIGFLFVGRGSESQRLRRDSLARQLDNVLFFDEVHPDEIRDLCEQCSVGIVALDPRHRSHNIPGKFLSYMQSGLPVLANVNAGNDLAALIRREMVGEVCESNQVSELCGMAERLLNQIDTDTGLPDRCRQLFLRDFSAERAARQIVDALAA